MTNDNTQDYTRARVFEFSERDDAIRDARRLLDDGEWFESVCETSPRTYIDRLARALLAEAKRVDELEGELEKAHSHMDTDMLTIAELTAENERMREAVNAAQAMAVDAEMIHNGWLVKGAPMFSLRTALARLKEGVKG